MSLAKIGLFVASTWTDWNLVEKELMDAIDEDEPGHMVVISGAHSSAEQRAVNIALSLGCNVAEFRANPQLGFAGAYSRRSSIMVDELLVQTDAYGHDTALALLFGDNDDATVRAALHQIQPTLLRYAGWHFDDDAEKIVRFDKAGEG